MKIGKKNTRRLLGFSCGIGAAAAVDLSSSHAAPIQMTLYTVMIFVPLFLGTWPDHNRHRFWPAMGAMCILHCLALYCIREVFPFNSIFEIVPLALIEAVVFFASIGKIVGDDSPAPA